MLSLSDIFVGGENQPRACVTSKLRHCSRSLAKRQTRLEFGARGTGQFSGHPGQRVCVSHHLWLTKPGIRLPRFGAQWIRPAWCHLTVHLASPLVLIVLQERSDIGMLQMTWAYLPMALIWSSLRPRNGAGGDRPGCKVPMTAPFYSATTLAFLEVQLILSWSASRPAPQRRSIMPTPSKRQSPPTPPKIRPKNSQPASP